MRALIFAVGGFLCVYAGTLSGVSSAMGAAPEARLPKEPGFLVGRFVFAYQDPEDGKGREAGLPKEDVFEKLTVPLKWVSGQYEASGAGEGGAETVLLGGAHDRRFGASAIVAVSRAVVSELNRRGIYGVLAAVDPEQIDLSVSPPEDLREGARGDLRMDVYYSRVAKVELQRAPRSGPEWLFPPDRVGRGIVANAPVQAGALLRKDDLQHYLDRVNRFEGRRAQSVLRAGEQPGTVNLALELNEQKRFSVHVTGSNSGTKETGEWRSRFGVEARQLAGIDDVLALDYTTSDFKKYQTFSFSADFGLGAGEAWKARFYGSYSDLSLSDLGLTDLERLDLGGTEPSFASTAQSVGVQAAWTSALAADWSLSLTGGGYILDASVDRGAFGGQAAGQGSSTYGVPYFSVGLEKQSSRGRLTGSLQMEHVATPDEGSAILGRIKPSNEAWVSRWNMAWSRRGGEFADLFSAKNTSQGGTHEVSLAARGQVAWDQARLVPHFQGVAGGMDSVRGYRESIAAGDTVSFATAEYRLQLNSVLKQRGRAAALTRESGAPYTVSEMRAPRGLGVEADRASGRGGAQSSGAFLGTGLPVEVVLRGFVDGAQVHQNETDAGSNEVGDRVLLGAGVGLDMVFRGRLNGMVRLDLGVALKGLKGGEPEVKAGSSRLHVSVFLAW